MGTKWKLQTEITPAQLVAGDGVPVQRAAGTKGWADLSKIVPPGFVFTQNAANSAEFKALSIANDTGFVPTAGSVQATNFRLALGSWDNTTTAGQVYSNSGMVLGFNCKSMNTGADFRVDNTKHALAVYWEANFHNTGYGVSNPHASESEWGVKFIEKNGASFSALRFKFGNEVGGTGGVTSPAGEYLADARIGVSGIRGRRGCDFLGWTGGGSMGWPTNNYDADVFVASIRNNELLYYYDGGTDYPLINMRLRQVSRTEVRMDFGKETDADPTTPTYTTNPPVPVAFIRYHSRPWSGTWPSAAGMTLGLADAPRSIHGGTAHGAPKDPLGTQLILGVYTGNAVNATKGIVIRGGRRGSDTANSGNLLEIQATDDGGATMRTGGPEWSWDPEGLVRVSAGQVLTSGATYTAIKANWDNYADPVGFLKVSVAGTTRYLALLSS